MSARGDERSVQRSDAGPDDYVRLLAARGEGGCQRGQYAHLVGATRPASCEHECDPLTPAGRSSWLEHRPSTISPAPAASSRQQLAQVGGELRGLVLGDQGVGVGDLDERPLRQQLRQAASVLAGHEAIFGGPRDERRAVKRSQ